MAVLSVVRWGRSSYELDADLAGEAAAASALGATWSLWEDRSAPPPSLLSVDVLVVNSKVRVTDVVLAALPAGALVLTTTSGFDHIDVDAARSHGVAVGRCPRARRDAVAEWSVAALVALLRRQPALDRAAREGRWVRPELPALAPRGLSGAVVVVVGLGVIGRHVADVLTALGASVRGVDPVVPGAWSLDDALDGADAVTLHCALSPTSRGLLDAMRLSRLPAHAVVVNTARGDVLDVETAVAAVAAGRLRGLAVDVFPREPWPALAAGAVDGVWLTPHAAGFTRDLGARIAAEVGETLSTWAAHRTLPARVV